MLSHSKYAGGLPWGAHNLYEIFPNTCVKVPYLKYLVHVLRIFKHFTTRRCPFLSFFLSFFLAFFIIRSRKENLWGP